MDHQTSTRGLLRSQWVIVIIVAFQLSCSSNPDPQTRLTTNEVLAELNLDVGPDCTLIARADQFERCDWIIVQIRPQDLGRFPKEVTTIGSQSTIEKIERISSYRFMAPSAFVRCYTIPSPMLGEIDVYAIGDGNKIIIDCTFSLGKDKKDK